MKFFWINSGMTTNQNKSFKGYKSTVSQLLMKMELKSGLSTKSWMTSGLSTPLLAT
jgi:hypothetical protein